MPGTGSCSLDFWCFFMKPVRRGRSNPDLFRERLDAIIDMRHSLVRLAALIPWSAFDESFGKFFKPIGRPAKPTRLMVGLHYLKHVYDLSDEARSAGAELRRSGMTGPTFAAMRLQAGRWSSAGWRTLITVCLEAGMYLPAQLYRRWETRPPGAGLQGQASNHSMLLRLRDVVVSDGEKAVRDTVR